jgi:acetolactate synthase-1/3 small subunit
VTGVQTCALPISIELTGPGSKLDAFLEAVEPAAILETVRTGASGIGRGDRIMKI